MALTQVKIRLQFGPSKVCCLMYDVPTFLTATVGSHHSTAPEPILGVSPANASHSFYFLFSPRGGNVSINLLLQLIDVHRVISSKELCKESYLLNQPALLAALIHRLDLLPSQLPKERFKVKVVVPMYLP